MSINIQFSFGWSPKPKIHFSMAILMFVIAGMVSALLYINANNDLATSIIVKGAVVASKVNSEGLHTPIVEYKNPEGEMLKFISQFSSNPQKYFNGDIVDVVISGETGKPTLKNFFTIYGLSAFAALFSLISLIGAIAIYFLRVRLKT